MPSIEAYLKIRLKRAALKRELEELSLARRGKLLKAFREGLRPFIGRHRFSFDWTVDFVSARKP